MNETHTQTNTHTHARTHARAHTRSPSVSVHKEDVYLHPHLEFWA